MGSGIENGREETSGEGLGCFVFGFFFLFVVFFLVYLEILCLLETQRAFFGTFFVVSKVQC